MTTRRTFLATASSLLLLLACTGTRSPSTTKVTAMSTTKKRILLAMTSHDRKGATGEATGAYVPEIAHPLEVFEQAGYEVEFASPKGGKVPLDGLDAKDDASQAFLRNAPLLARLHASLRSEDVDPSRYAAVFFAGGHGAMWDLPDDPGFRRVTAAIWERGGVVSAVCHGPAALVDVRLADGTPLVSGRRVSAFTDEEERAVGLDRVVPFLLEDRLVAAGAKHEGAPTWRAHVVTDGRLVTGQNPASARGVAEAVVKVLASP